MTEKKSYYTGEIYHRDHGDGIHTVAAKFHNPNTKQNFYMDERDLHDYIDVSTDTSRGAYMAVMRELQQYKQEHDIELRYHPVDEWELTNYSKLELD